MIVLRSSSFWRRYGVGSCVGELLLHQGSWVCFNWKARIEWIFLVVSLASCDLSAAFRSPTDWRACRIGFCIQWLRSLSLSFFSTASMIQRIQATNESCEWRACDWPTCEIHARNGQLSIGLKVRLTLWSQFQWAYCKRTHSRIFWLLANSWVVPPFFWLELKPAIGN